MNVDTAADPSTSETDQTSGAKDRNSLALVRTDLANERTLLAYVRTAIMLAATGVTIIKFFPGRDDCLVYGGLTITLGLVFATAGFVRYLRLHRNLHQD